jgi:hypothetical protein
MRTIPEGNENWRNFILDDILALDSVNSAVAVAPESLASFVSGETNRDSVLSEPTTLFCSDAIEPGNDCDWLSTDDEGQRICFH